MSFPWSYSVLGLVPGYVSRDCNLLSLLIRYRLIFTVFVAASVLYT